MSTQDHKGGHNACVVCVAYVALGVRQKMNVGLESVCLSRNDESTCVQESVRTGFRGDGGVRYGNGSLKYSSMIEKSS